jgi:hypothetical protein
MLSDSEYKDIVNKLNYLFLPFEESKDRIWWVLCFGAVPDIKFFQCWFEAKVPENGNTYTYYSDLAGSLVGESDGDYREALNHLLKNIDNRYLEQRKRTLHLVKDYD